VRTFFNLRKILNMNKLSVVVFSACAAMGVAMPAQAQYNATTPAIPRPASPAPATPAPAAPAATTAPAAPVAAAPAATPINVPKHNCVKPEVAGKPKTNDELKVLNANLATYRDCLTTYSSEMRRYADAHIEAGNVSVEEYNEFIKVVREKTK
jgi:predicted lipid-binding transport protein (Tim44 family)